MATRSPQDSSSHIPDGKDLRFGIVVSDWNKEITDKLLAACTETLRNHQVPETQINVIRVPGSFELPMGAKLLLSRDQYDAIICLGCVIKGETKHDEYISQAVAQGIMHLGIVSNVPVIFGVLTPNDLAQAEARAGGTHGNKGAEAADTALRMAALKQEVFRKPHKIGFA